MGKALYDKLIPTLTERGFKTAIAVIAIPNPASERLHEAFGFRRAGTLRHVGWKFDQWHDVAFWQCFLNDEDGAPELPGTTCGV